MQQLTWSHLDALRWLRSQEPPCPWDATVCALATENHGYDVLGWALWHGCPVRSPEDHWVDFKFQRLQTHLLFLTCIPCTSRRQFSLIDLLCFAKELVNLPAGVIAMAHLSWTNVVRLCSVLHLLMVCAMFEFTYYTTSMLGIYS